MVQTRLLLVLPQSAVDTEEDERETEAMEVLAEALEFQEQPK
jgi:hypothetical protein